MAGRAASRAAEHRFFTITSLILLIGVAWGFAPSYYLVPFLDQPRRSFITDGQGEATLFILHGLAYSAWMVLLAAQVLLVAAGRTAQHRKLGRAVLVLAPVMVVLGSLASWRVAVRGFHDVPVPTDVFLAVPMLTVPVFALFVTMGWRTRNRPDAHKRWMLLATLAITGAGFARIPLVQQLVPPSIDITLVALLALIVWDVFSLKRVHQVTLWGGLVSLIVLVLPVPIGMTPAWRALVAPLVG